MSRSSLAPVGICLLVALFHANPSSALSCEECDDVYTYEPCDDPICCKSETLTDTICGCCQECAKAEGESCGGNWGFSGRCGPGLTCFNQCMCEPGDWPPCIFPFVSEGKKYEQCMLPENSRSNRTWCALAVNSTTGEVLDDHYSWGDCSEECSCDNFNYSEDLREPGTCVNDQKRKEVEANAVDKETGKPIYRYEFHGGVDRSPNNAAPKCTEDGIYCRCVKVNPGDPGGCTSLFGSKPDGFCFLENLQDPNDATKNCFEDARWSKKDGRFWSREACESWVDPWAKPVPPQPTSVMPTDVD